MGVVSCVIDEVLIAVAAGVNFRDGEATRFPSGGGALGSGQGKL